ncbi:hypothetical protein L226DRAFT_471169 [Lentinus tigrinus ALCF2SS1-7]|uniref:BTB domain-containing protein n=1 Tax=Lentinus tigrinus ALCF2SS1-6 TaxID=1328759 RepID=A0A5C2S520_9APHY|nr:hypothetical protein L227DRAFT_504782 [Lentinus tigrinus ALCF2SS1-6]RPD69798.1 hypothetical protein L226DRAFT_471169 [Lentinus tigrinus ALCF2SS1-7]
MPAHPNLQHFRTTDFWFADGNIILLVQDVAFKVHRGQLVRHSDIFHDMFSLPQPVGDMIDGCPWVQLHDDPGDVLHLLRALYDGLYFTKRTSGDFCAVSAVLRLSTKYLIEHLRERCLMRLEADWPTTLGGWDKREQHATVDTRYCPREHFPHPILVIQLCQELGLDHMLPSALYDLSRYGPRKIAAGASTVPALLSSRSRAHAHADPQDPNTVIVRLDLSDLQAVFRGREQGQRFLAAFIEQELSGRAISANCANRPHANGHHCRESYYFIMLNLLRAVGGIATGRDADPLFSLLQGVEMLSRTDFSDGTRQCGLRICASCKEDFSIAVAKARREAWEQIPAWFGLQAKDAPPTSMSGRGEWEPIQA